VKFQIQNRIFPELTLTILQRTLSYKMLHGFLVLILIVSAWNRTGEKNRLIYGNGMHMYAFCATIDFNVP
jgi:hypothetical protein